MTHFAIGDIHGCFETLQSLLERIEFDPGSDTLWIVGDLVRRGPHSLECLRWALGLDARHRVVLGNHDLHLLAEALGVREPRPDDDLAAIRSAPDFGNLVDGLRRVPFLHRERIGERDLVLVHAGIPPGWSVDRAESLAADAAAWLRDARATDLLRRLYADETTDPDRELTDPWVIPAATRALTSIRVIDAAGRLDPSFKGPVADLPADRRPWFEARPESESTHFIFGHWAALGLHRGRHATGLDTGCAWGGSLTALELETGRVHSVTRVEPRDDQKS